MSKEFDEISHETIMRDLYSEHKVSNMLGIMHAVWVGDKSEECVARIKELTQSNENDHYSSVTVGSYAVAALDLLKIERYKGEDSVIRKLIKTKLAKDLK